MLTEEQKSKRMALFSKILAKVAKMKENCSRKTSLSDMKHKFIRIKS
jgi:hypothetical protein